MAESAEPDPGHAFVETLVGFARELRAAGLPVGTGDGVTFCAAMEPLDPTDLMDLYWGGRATLVTRREQIPTYHETFLRYFLDHPAPKPDEARPFTIQQREEARTALQVPETEQHGEERQEEEAILGLMASDVSALKHKAFASCTPEELAALRRIMRTVRLTPPRRRSRRTAAASAGTRPDLRRTVREAMRTHGDPARLRWRQRRKRPRPLVLVLDVSGSMADYSRALLQYAHITSRATSKVEVFCFGTRLTRITRELEHRRPDQALDRAARAVVDWEGGTRIGGSLDAFVRDFGRRGTGRGGIVVICSDGLDRGDPALLASAMQRLSRLCHRVVWLNPHGAEPASLGMAVATPYVDQVLTARSLADLEAFARSLG
ncbi:MULTISPECIES: VWA domain-containing protein [unclassified Nocardioides]|uniref:vWA domain-containing protein n=1 Tax=unclassified Nocardioides TaxID=2615069 RepID=UPI000056FFE2|nr:MULTISPECIES: VWA domain-containing protein [unclassified Nocardioides]ABL79783.1 VWA containing CoxE family protein [Nocardioides sp. JS614]